MSNKIEEMEARIKAVEESQAAINARFLGTMNQTQEEMAKRAEELTQLNNQIQSLQEAVNRLNRLTNHLDSKMEGVRSDSSTGIVVTILVFTVLFVFSLFFR